MKTAKTEKDKDKALREQVLYLLEGGGAHAKFAEIVAGIPPKILGQKPAGLPHSLWMLLEHLRIAQWDILEFSRNSKHASPKWPEGYWPKTDAPPSYCHLEHQREEIPPGPPGNARARERSQDRSVRQNSLGRWPDYPSRSPVAGRPQHLSSGADVRCASSPGSVAGEVNIKFATDLRR